MLGRVTEIRAGTTAIRETVAVLRTTIVQPETGGRDHHLHQEMMEGRTDMSLQENEVWRESVIISFEIAVTFESPFF